jgi:hypothetical protein
VILSFRAFEKVKLYEAWHLFTTTVARQPNVLESCFAERVGFGSEAFDKCVRDESLKKKALDWRNIAYPKFLESTPTFFVNGDR